MSKFARRLSILRGVRAIIVVILATVFLATATYSAMSDGSVRGMTTRITYANRYCTTSPGTLVKTVTFYILASVWSTSSLHTSISSVAFSLSVDGVNLGTSQASDSSWDPGQYARFNMTFTDSQASPVGLPSTSTLVLAMTTHATAGVAAASVTASDQAIETLGTISC